MARRRSTAQTIRPASQVSRPVKVFLSLASKARQTPNNIAPQSSKTPIKDSHAEKAGRPTVPDKSQGGHTVEIQANPKASKASPTTIASPMSHRW
jgi:hypothetical protein